MLLLPHTYTTPIVDLSNADWIMRMKTNAHNTYRKRKIITAFKRIETVQLFFCAFFHTAWFLPFGVFM
jgi:hypothetical protein